MEGEAPQGGGMEKGGAGGYAYGKAMVGGGLGKQWWGGGGGATQQCWRKGRPTAPPHATARHQPPPPPPLRRRRQRCGGARLPPLPSCLDGCRVAPHCLPQRWEGGGKSRRRFQANRERTTNPPPHASFTESGHWRAADGGGGALRKDLDASGDGECVLAIYWKGGS